jgi:hypothetical protein
MRLDKGLSARKFSSRARVALGAASRARSPIFVIAAPAVARMTPVCRVSASTCANIGKAPPSAGTASRRSILCPCASGNRRPLSGWQGEPSTATHDRLDHPGIEKKGRGCRPIDHAKPHASALVDPDHISGHPMSGHWQGKHRKPRHWHESRMPAIPPILIPGIMPPIGIEPWFIPGIVEAGERLD